MRQSDRERAFRGTMSRRELLRGSLVTVVGGLLAGCASASPSSPAAPAKPAESKPAATSAPAAAKPAEAPKAADKVTVLRLGTPVSPETSNTKAAQLFGEELGKLSSGQFKVEVYPSSQLGGVREMLEAVQLGTQSMSIATPAWAANFAKKMDVLNLLYLAKSGSQLFAALDGEFGQKLKAEMEGVGIGLLGWWALGSRNVVNTVRPINVPEDLNGLKLRAQASPVWVQSLRALGANPVAMNFPEVYSGLQQRTIDGFENSVTEIFSGKFHEVAKYLSMTEHIWDIFGVFINKGLYDGFTPDQQKMVGEAMKTATQWQRARQAEETMEALDKLRGLMQVNEISEANQKLFRDKVVPVYAEFENDLGKAWIEEAIKALG